MLKYLITFAIMILFAAELVLFVKIIARYRKRFVPLLTMLGMFVINFGLLYALGLLPALQH